MKSHVLAAAAAGAFLCWAGAARADCSTSKNDFEDVYCAAKNFIDADNDLNAAYKALVARLSADEKATLKKSEAAWMKSRNGDCGKTDGDGYYVDLSCAVDSTRNRTRFLRDRAAECAAGQCDAAKLAQAE
ncbi:MAG TPA: lysozyme inhibitor LprI family protein [Dongiaceae bacterium]|nr:lysozyme inhibitor LprI family protein [Dongiaceae bacterium]